MVSQVANINLMQQAGQAGRQTAAASTDTRPSKPDFKLGSDNVTISTQSIATASANVSNYIRGDGTKAFADKPEYKAGVQRSKGYAVKEVTQDYEREEQRQGHQENMKRAGILNGFIDRIKAAINGE